MKNIKLFKLIYIALLSVVLCFTACEDDINNEEDDTGGDSTKTEEVDEIDFSDLGDTYDEIAGESYCFSWGVHNVHDPMIRQVGDYFYCYSTDVGYGISVSSGIQIRRSENLVEWDYKGHVFDELPEKGLDWLENTVGTTVPDAIWAPAFYTYNGENRLYYSLPGDAAWTGVIGLATSTSATSGFEEVDMLVGSKGYSETTTNCIDPSVFVTPSNEHWMVYGSGSYIRIVQLDPKTGLLYDDDDYGTTIAYRGYTNGAINGNIEGPEIIYNSELGYYYLFIAYDALETKYNTRVGRSTNIEGPYYDWFEEKLVDKTDNFPMVTAPYGFKGHQGYQGISHCTVFEDSTGQYYYASQARPASNYYFMNLHVRQLFWTADGWPMASPERYAGLELAEIPESGIAGDWEMIDFDYEKVPGYTQEDADIQRSSYVVLNEDGTIGSSSSNMWSFEDPWLTLTIDGVTTDVYVSVGRDWENSVDSTIVFTGIASDGMPWWGKKINP